MPTDKFCPEKKGPDELFDITEPLSILPRQMSSSN